MPRYRVTNQHTQETWEVEASSAEQARQWMGWSAGICRGDLVRNESFTEIEPPKVAERITPPRPGISHIWAALSLSKELVGGMREAQKAIAV